MSEYQSGAGDASIATQAQEKVQHTAQQASQAASGYLRDQTETRGKQAADELQTLASALRRSSHSLHADGKSTSANAVETVIDRIEGLGRYLEQSSSDKMLRDLEAFGRRKPWGMIGLGLGIGAAASRFLKASSTRRFEEEQSQRRQQQVQAFGSSSPMQSGSNSAEPWAPPASQSVGTAVHRGG